MKPTVIAIDGPAASGKSSVARGLAEQIGFFYVNSGVMYRAITWHVLRVGVDPAATASVAQATAVADIVTGFDGRVAFIEIDGFRLSTQLHDEPVNRSVSAVSTVPTVRDRLVAEFRFLATRHNVVVEGRDIGSVVFPDAPFKFYLDAPASIRQRRRTAQGQTDEIATRDHLDSSRHTAPLVIARDACVIDTSELDLGGVIEVIHGHLAAAGLFSNEPARLSE